MFPQDLETRYRGAGGAGPSLVAPSGHRYGNRLEVDSDIELAVERLRLAFPGVCIWHGEFTGSLWAMLPGRLIEARVAADLARRLYAELGGSYGRAGVRPLPGRGGADEPVPLRRAGVADTGRKRRRSVRAIVEGWLRPLVRPRRRAF